MIIKVCGLNDADNMRQVAEAGADWLGMIFWDRSPRRVDMLRIPTGMMPDSSGKMGNSAIGRCKKVGVFVDANPQYIITRVIQFGLDAIQLHGHEMPTMIRNLKATLVPDLKKKITIIKAISIEKKEDLERCHDYEDIADIFLFDTKCKCVGGSGESFDWSVINDYHGDQPFILSGGIGPDDAKRVKAVDHPKMMGVDINSRFELQPGVKDVEKVSAFIREMRE